jgi:hypothetical protein
MVVVPVASRAAAVMVVAPITPRSAAIVSRVMPFPVAAVTLFPLPALPIAMPVIVPVAIPARTDDNNTWRYCIHGTRDADVYSNINVSEGN